MNRTFADYARLSVATNPEMHLFLGSLTYLEFLRERYMLKEHTVRLGIDARASKGDLRLFNLNL